MHDLDRIQMESFEFEGEDEGVFNESEVTQLASELMEVANEAEMEQFLGDLIKKAGRAAGGFIKSPAGQALGGILKSAAKKALPIAGGALGGFFGGPAGAAIGSKVASFAGDRLGLEAEYEESEFETAKSFVRMAADAAKSVASAPASSNPRAAATAAVAQAAKSHLPALLAAGGATSSASGRSQGQWIRRGTRVILLGV